MEAQRQVVHVHEGAEGELAHRVLADTGKQRVAQLVEAHLCDAQHIVGDHQHPAAPAGMSGSGGGVFMSPASASVAHLKK